MIQLNEEAGVILKNWSKARLVVSFAFLFLVHQTLLYTHNNVIDPRFREIETNFYSILGEVIYQDKSRSPLLVSSNGNNLFVANRNTREVFLTTRNKEEFSLVKIFDFKEIGIGSEHPDNKILDIIIIDTNIYIAIGHGSYSSSNCGSVKVFKLLLSKSLQITDHSLIFSSTPCVVGDTGGHVWTARLATDYTNLFIAGGNWLVDWQLGTFPWTGFSNLEMMQNIPPSNFFGKVSTINLKTLETRVYAEGLRNLGGLFFDSQRNMLFNTDNGTRGGDELNDIQKDKHYGWPKVTLGLPYGPDKKVGALVNQHSGFKEPLFSWTPSISPSTINKITFGEFSKYWKDDLIIGSLKDRSIHRIRLGTTNSVLYDEKIKIKERVRSHTVLSSGEIVVATDSGKLIIYSIASEQISGSTPEVG